MSECQWKYIDGPIVHDLTTYLGSHAVFALWCTGQRITRASYTDHATTCLDCIAETCPMVDLREVKPGMHVVDVSTPKMSSSLMTRLERDEALPDWRGRAIFNTNALKKLKFNF